jgi:quercetin dioxygenase-like cupin family protein
MLEVAPHGLEFVLPETQSTESALRRNAYGATSGRPLHNPSEEVIRVGHLSVRFLVTAENSAGTIAAFELVVPGAQRLPAPAHSHDHYEETIYGIDGVFTWTVDGKQIDVGPGQALFIPRGAVHRFDNNRPRT